MLELASVVMFGGALLGTSKNKQTNKNVRYYVLFVTILKIPLVRKLK